MSLEQVTLRPHDIDSEIAAAWNALPASRGEQADFYDSHAWFSSWRDVTDRRRADAVRIPAVFDGPRPVALLPLVVSGRRWYSVGIDIRTRSRVVCENATPSAESLGLLAEEIARSGVRELGLYRMPTRDPATNRFVAALRDAGFRVFLREKATEQLVTIEGGLAEHRASHKGFAQNCRRFGNRIERLWDLTLEEYGTSSDFAVRDGFSVYEKLQEMSWKHAFTPTLREQRLALLAQAEELRWARLFVLRFDQVPVAAHVWFRLGDVATWFSTAYDQRLGAWSPGSVLQWRAQERLLEEGNPPRLLDLLPGENPQKARLAPSRPALVIVEAVRRSVAAGVTFPVKREVKYVATAVARRLRARLRRPGRVHAGCAPGKVRLVEVEPDENGAAQPLETAEPAVLRYLAAATGHDSTEGMTSLWDHGDTWWRAGREPNGLVRLTVGEDGRYRAREVVRLSSNATLEGLAAEVAAAVRAPIIVPLPDESATDVGLSVVVHEPALPWPRGWVQGNG